MEIFSERLKYARAEKGYSQRQIAKMLDVPQSTYQAYELLGTKNGREPRFKTVNKLADILEVSTDYLFGRQDY